MGECTEDSAYLDFCHLLQIILHYHLFELLSYASSHLDSWTAGP